MDCNGQVLVSGHVFDSSLDKLQMMVASGKKFETETDFVLAKGRAKMGRAIVAPTTL